jgi:hypothetical protein
MGNNIKNIYIYIYIYTHTKGGEPVKRPPAYNSNKAQEPNPTSRGNKRMEKPSSNKKPPKGQPTIQLTMQKITYLTD